MVKKVEINNSVLMTYVSDNINDVEFAVFLDSCISKWSKMKPECDTMDIIMQTICERYKITVDELIKGKKNTVPRSIMFYMIRKTLKDLSFETLGDIFERQKSYVYKSYDEAKFMIERHKKKDAISLVSTIKNNLKSQNLLPEEIEK